MSWETISKVMTGLPREYEEMREIVAKAVDMVLPITIDENDKVVIEKMEKIDFVPGDFSLYYVSGHVESRIEGTDEYENIDDFIFCIIDIHGEGVYVKNLGNLTEEERIQ